MKNSYLVNFSLLIFLFVFLTANVSAQSDESSPSFGITASFQSGQSDFLFPILVTPLLTIAPGFGISGMKDAGNEMQFALVGKYYLYESKVAPFLGGRLGTILYTPNKGKALDDYIIGFLGGGEYFFDKNFSFGIQCEFNLGFANKNSVRFDNPGGQAYSTSTALFATVYF
jgi:hypothetical protein